MTTLLPRIALTLFSLFALPALAADAAPAAASAPASAASAARRHVPAPRTGPGGSTMTAKHGGLVMSDKGVDIELDAQPDYLDLYLTADDKPVDLNGATGHITLLNGVDITDAYLDPSADKQRLTVSGKYKLVHGTRVIVRVTLADKRWLTQRYLIVMLPPPARAASAPPAASAAATPGPAATSAPAMPASAAASR
jgi:hypothetical protein